ASGIDLFLLVLDAGEGARPQTHEHLAILRLLGIEHGVVAVTKADAVDEETLDLALAEAAELAPEAETVAVSAKTGAGLDELRAALARAADLVADSNYLGSDAARLHVDRVFTLRGIGTVATGTPWSRTIGAGDGVRAVRAGGGGGAAGPARGRGGGGPGGGGGCGGGRGGGGDRPPGGAGGPRRPR